MAFIDIFNFKKYFSKPSDAQVARYGHVNAAYDALKESLSFTSAAYTLESGYTEIDITTNAGVITVTDSLSPETNVTVTLYNSNIKTTSTIVFTINQGSTAPTSVQTTFDDGFVEIRLSNNSTTLGG